LGRLGDRLELTEEQKAQIQLIIETNKENVQTANTAVRESIQALSEAAENGTEAEIIAAGKAVGDAYTEQALQRVNVTTQIKEKLTVEQLAELEALKTEVNEQRPLRLRQGMQGPRGAGRRGGRGSRGPRPTPPVVAE
jgi:Spy/CpxP family protein refolding chaperone